MGVIKRGILGGFSGRIGNIVGSSWKGIAVIKSLPLSVANPKTSAQVAQRSKFSETVALSAILLASFIKPLWDRFASQMSGYNAFMAKNVALINSGAGVTYQDFIMSVGKMAETSVSAITISNADPDATIAWVDDSDEGLKLASDVVYACAFNDDLSKVAIAALGFVRSDAECDIAFNVAPVTGEKIFYCLAFRRADGTIVSDSKIYTDTV